MRTHSWSGGVPGARVARGRLRHCPPHATFTDADCAVGFEHPTSWRVQLDDGPYALPCTFVLRPLDYEALLIDQDSVDVFSVRVTVVAEPFDIAAPDHGFARREGAWVVLGRQGIAAPAAALERPGWTGVRGARGAGCYRIGGAYVGMCEARATALGRGDRSVLLEGSLLSEDVFELVAATVDWYAPGPSRH